MRAHLCVSTRTTRHPCALSCRATISALVILPPVMIAVFVVAGAGDFGPRTSRRSTATERAYVTTKGAVQAVKRSMRADEIWELRSDFIAGWMGWASARRLLLVCASLHGRELDYSWSSPSHLAKREDLLVRIRCPVHASFWKGHLDRQWLGRACLSSCGGVTPHGLAAHRRRLGEPKNESSGCRLVLPLGFVASLTD